MTLGAVETPSAVAMPLWGWHTMCPRPAPKEGYGRGIKTSRCDRPSAQVGTRPLTLERGLGYGT